jgi:hypothetical protein
MQCRRSIRRKRLNTRNRLLGTLVEMAISIRTATPKALLASIKKAIDDGHVETWSYDEDGDFTHSVPQWQNKAWLRPKVEPGMLRLGLLGRRNVEMTYEVYGVYHGRFIEMVITHFDDKFTTASATAQKDSSVDDF